MKYFLAMLLGFALIAGCSKGPDVKKLNSGLRYTDDSLGTGKVAKTGDVVTAHFAIWIIKDSSNLYSDWTKDSSKASLSLGNSRAFNQPVKFKIGAEQFVKGSDEGIVGMKVGGKRTMIIPSYLAYGKQGMGPVPPNTNLKVVIELLDTKEIAPVKMWDVDTTKMKTTPSGLKYVIIQEGVGANPDSGSVVSVHYSGYLTDGKKFDSSVERDQPFMFVIGKKQVIQGWEEGIRLLKKGGKARFVVPPALGYKERGSGPIPPNATLIFDVELVDVK